MWWGGGGSDRDPETSDSESKSEDKEVMEILSEEDTQEILIPAEQEEETEDDEDDEDLEKLKAQFQESESLLGQLKGVLRSNEEKLANKEKEVQVGFN